MKKLFQDDLRTEEMIYAEASDFDIVRSYNDFVRHIQENGLPDFINFENDLA